MTDPRNDLGVERDKLREVVRHAQAHAYVLEQYRMGENAGILVLEQLLAEIPADDRLHQLLEVHLLDERRHARTFTEWIQRLGITPQPLPSRLETYFFNSERDYQVQSRLLEVAPQDVRHVFLLCGINAVEQLAYGQFENHLLALKSREEIVMLKGVMADEKFHLSYVEAELDRHDKGTDPQQTTTALKMARSRFAHYRRLRRAEMLAAIDRLLGQGGNE